MENMLLRCTHLKNMETKIKRQILLKFVYFVFNFLIIGKRERRQKCYLIYTEFQ